MIAASIDWLPTAERVRVPMRRVSGATVEILLGRLPTGAYQVATSAVVPGHGARATVLDDDRIAGNRFNAVLLGLRELRLQWRQIPAIVSDLDEFAERWE